MGSGIQHRSKTNTSQNVGNVERVFSSALGGALLLSGLRSPSLGSAARLIGGGALLYRGVTGHCHMYAALGRTTADGGSDRDAVQKTITIGKSPDELYRVWQDPEHVAAMMKHFARVEGQGDGSWRWTVSLPGKPTLTWSTSPTAQRPGELISWQTEPDAPFEHEGSVRFKKAPEDLGTEVTLCMGFGAPRGALRTLTGKMLRAIPRALEETILRNCKSLCEAGEIPTLERNPDARTPARLERPETKPKNPYQSQSAVRSMS